MPGASRWAEFNLIHPNDRANWLSRAEAYRFQFWPEPLGWKLAEPRVGPR